MKVIKGERGITFNIWVRASERHVGALLNVEGTMN